MLMRDSLKSDCTVHLGVDLGDGHVCRDTPLISVRDYKVTGATEGTEYVEYDTPRHVTQNDIKEIRDILNHSCGWVDFGNKAVWCAW